MTRLLRPAWLSAPALLAVMVLAASVQAQEFRGTITGTVTDPSSAILPGATVTAAAGALDGSGSCRWSSWAVPSRASCSPWRRSSCPIRGCSPCTSCGSRHRTIASP